MFHHLKTVVEIIYHSLTIAPQRIFLSYKEDNQVKSITYKEFVQLMEEMAAGFNEIGINNSQKVGIIAENSYKWILSDMAIISLGAVDVPRGSDSTPQEIFYILNHAEVKYCIVENITQLEKVLSLKDDLPHLKYLILFYGEIDGTKHNHKDVTIYHFDDLLKRGKELLPSCKEELKKIRETIKEDNLLTIIYTSGTTGNPKGVMQTHKNIIHNVCNLTDVIHFGVSKERWVSILPIWHSFERTVEYIIMTICSSMYYSKPTAKHLLPDMEYFRPTYMVTVPRIWEALYSGIINRMKSESHLKWLLFNFFAQIGITFVKNKKILQNLVARYNKPTFIISFMEKIKALSAVTFLFIFYQLGDLLIFKKIREKTGNSLICPISGGGALPFYIDLFFAAIKIELHEGWGLTETAPIIGVRAKDRLIPGTVGAPAPGIELFIGDENRNPLPNQHQKGIIYVRGDNVMPGYYKDPERTNAVLSDDGWFNTGDLGMYTITGEVHLEGRAKDTIVLTGGENIEPEPIESKIKESPMISNVMVVGQDKKVLGVLIVPSETNLIDYAERHHINCKNYQELCKNQKVIEEYKKIIKAEINEKNGFKNYERIIYITLIAKHFEPGLELTHSLKLKRNVISELYHKEISEMYSKG